jgi:four helix bundle protein
MDLVGSDKRTGDDIAERLLKFAIRIIKLVNALPNTIVARHIAGQLIRSGTSCGSNYEESRGAESRADFIHKLAIVLKEIKESRFWLKLIYHAQIMKSEQIELLIEECEELAAIIAKSIITAKANK